MSTTELQLETKLEQRVLRTLQAYFRHSNEILIKESLVANGLEEEQAEEILGLLQQKYTVSEIMEILREKGLFRENSK